MAGVNVRFGAAGTVPSRNQLSNVLMFLSQSGHLISPRFPAGLAHAFFQSSRASSKTRQRASQSLPEEKYGKRLHIKLLIRTD